MEEEHHDSSWKSDQKPYALGDEHGNFECYNCIETTDSVYCNGCVTSSWLRFCNNCVNTQNSSFCSGLQSCNYCVYCTNCSNTINSTNCTGCNGCNGCTACQGCTPAVNCGCQTYMAKSKSTESEIK